MACALVCGLLTGAAAVLWLGCPSAPAAPAPTPPAYSSTFSPAGEGCWTESKTDGNPPEKICGAVERHMVTA